MMLPFRCHFALLVMNHPLIFLGECLGKRMSGINNRTGQRFEGQSQDAHRRR
jgi:hypothetical protein